MEQNLINFADDVADEIDQSRGRERFREAVLYGTDWTVQSLLHQIEVGNIDLAPDFQRRDAWSLIAKSRFIESVILQLPIPQIVLAERRDDKGSFVVLDGKQRLLTLAQFAGSFGEEHVVLRESRRPVPLRLTGLKILAEFNGLSYEEIRGRGEFSGLMRQFDNHTIRSSLIRNWPDDDYLYEVFIRLNTGSTKLSPQELRQAMKPGAFTELLAQRSSSSRVIQRILGINRPDFRMRDVDLMLRMVAFSGRLDEYRGELKEFLDSTHDRYNATWAQSGHAVISLIDQIENTLAFLCEKFPSARKVGRRWKGGKYENAINRAVLDVQLGLALNPGNRAALADIDIEAAFKAMCDNDQAFVESVSGTTKTIYAVRTRYERWAAALTEASGQVMTLPNLPYV